MAASQIPTNFSSKTDVEKVDMKELEHVVSEIEFVHTGLADSAKMKKLLWKTDFHVVPPLFVLFLLAFLDRTNIGNANVQGLSKGLGLSGPQYNIALFVFFIPYILLEVPSNIILKHLAPSTWLSLIIVLWGVATIGQGLITNFAGLVGMRFVLGIFEAGLFPGCIYLISMYYERYELQWRLSLFFSASIIAGAFGGLLAYAISKMDNIGGYAGWRWIFILEGALTCLVGALAKFWVVDWPETAKFLTDEDRELLVAKLSRASGLARMDTLNSRAVKRVFLDWKLWVGTFMYMGVITTGYATSFFIPTIINQLGYTAEQAQIRSIPIFIVATVVCLITAWCTDRLQHRYAFIMAGSGIGIAGYILLLCQTYISVEVRYFGCFMITAGGFMAQPVTLAWLQNSLGGHYKRSIGAAVQIGIGNCGGIVASNIFIKTQAPFYHTGFGTALGMLVLCGIMATIMLFGLRWENKKRDLGGRDYRYTEEAEDIANMGDDHPTFRFTY